MNKRRQSSKATEKKAIVERIAFAKAKAKWVTITISNFWKMPA